MIRPKTVAVRISTVVRAAAYVTPDVDAFDVNQRVYDKLAELTTAITQLQALQTYITANPPA